MLRLIPDCLLPVKDRCGKVYLLRRTAVHRHVDRGVPAICGGHDRRDVADGVKGRMHDQSHGEHKATVVLPAVPPKIEYASRLLGVIGLDNQQVVLAVFSQQAGDVELHRRQGEHRCTRQLAIHPYARPQYHRAQLQHCTLARPRRDREVGAVPGFSRVVSLAFELIVVSSRNMNGLPRTGDIGLVPAAHLAGTLGVKAKIPVPPEIGDRSTTNGLAPHARASECQQQATKHAVEPALVCHVRYRSLMLLANSASHTCCAIPRPD